jgi:hypothetical protein
MFISAHNFLTFVNRIFNRDKKYIFENLDFNDINWATMITNSFEGDKFKKFGPMTEGGKPLLQVCIENENPETKTWQLKKLMELLLT